MSHGDTSIFAGIPQPSSRDPGFFHRRRDRTGQTTQEGILISEGGSVWGGRKRKRSGGLVDARGKRVRVKPPQRQRIIKVTGKRPPMPTISQYSKNGKRRGKGFLLIKRKRGRGYYRKYPSSSKKYFK